MLTHCPRVTDACCACSRGPVSPGANSYMNSVGGGSGGGQIGGCMPRLPCPKCLSRRMWEAVLEKGHAGVKSWGGLLQMGGPGTWLEV